MKFSDIFLIFSGYELGNIQLLKAKKNIHPTIKLRYSIRKSHDYAYYYDVEDEQTAIDLKLDKLKLLNRKIPIKNWYELGIKHNEDLIKSNLGKECIYLTLRTNLPKRAVIGKVEPFLNTLLIPYNKNPKKVIYKAQILPTTIYNYKDLAKQYKEHTQLGYSKMLPQIALGQSQSSILATAYFENDILDLVNVFIPPLMSSTMNADVLNRNKSASDSENGAGRPEKEDDEKSTKTIQNR